jgi:tetratricopeptide (TPR) repeat protein
MNINFKRKNMNELEQKIIELSKNNENEKIEALLEERLKQDPDNIDLLFRLANLELWPPFVDYYACYLFIEKTRVVCNKHQTIASLTITNLKNNWINKTNSNDSLDFTIQHVVHWFYEGKNLNTVDTSIKQIIEFGRCDNPKKIKSFLENKLQQDPNNIEFLFLSALIEFFQPYPDYDRSIKFLEKMITASKELEVFATIFFAYVEDKHFYIEEALLHRLKNFETTNNEINSMIYYAQAWPYIVDKPNMAKQKLAEQYLEKSINLCPNYVWNYIKLARLYIKTERKQEAKQLIQKALHNIKKIDSKSISIYDLNEFLNKCIKGIWLHEAQLEIIKKLDAACN